MAKAPSPFGKSRGGDLLVLYVPSHDRDQQAIDQNGWVDGALELLGRLFRGATAFPQGRGVWRDDEREGRLVFDEPIIIQCYASTSLFRRHAAELLEFLHAMGRETRQGAVGFVLNREFFEIDFPLE